MTAYQAMMAKEAKLLSSMVTTFQEGPVLPLTIGRKTVLNGDEIALPSEDVVEVERRFRSIRVELQARGELEEFFARRVATMTVRVERGVRLETANLSNKVRNAVADFDASRFDEALKLYDWISAEPWANSRKLHSTLEGVDRMIQAFRALKDDLTHPSRVSWDWCHLEKLENLMGRRLGDLPLSRAKALSEALGGDFQHLEPSDGDGLEASARQSWARDQLADLIDREIDRLEAHRQTFDLDAIAQGRAESVDRVLFDASKEASQARRYEAAAERSLYKALGELRKLQARKAQQEPDLIDELDDLEPGLGSFCPGDPVEQPNHPEHPDHRTPSRPNQPARRPKHRREPVRSRST